MSSEVALVRAARDGDRGAWDGLIQAHQDRIRHFVVAMTGDPVAGDDVTQEALRRAFERLAALREPERFPSWLLAIAANECRSHFRQLARAAQSLDTPESGGLERAAQQRSALSSLLRRESVELIAAAIDRLPVLLREAFLLVHQEGIPYADVARELGTEPKTLYVRAHRAKALLRRTLGPVVDTFWSQPRTPD